MDIASQINQMANVCINQSAVLQGEKQTAFAALGAKGVSVTACSWELTDFSLLCNAEVRNRNAGARIEPGYSKQTQLSPTSLCTAPPPSVEFLPKHLGSSVKEVANQSLKVDLRVMISSSGLEQPHSLPCAGLASPRTSPQARRDRATAQGRRRLEASRLAVRVLLEHPHLRNAHPNHRGGCAGASAGSTCQKIGAKQMRAKGTGTGFRAQGLELLRQKGSP